MRVKRGAKRDSARRLDHVRQVLGHKTVREFYDHLAEGWPGAVTYSAALTYHLDRTPPIKYLVRVAEVTGWRLEWLATGKGAKTEAEELARRVAEGFLLREEVRHEARRALLDEFPEFEILPTLAQAVVWRTWQRLIAPLTFAEDAAKVESALEKYTEPLGRALGKALQAPLDALAAEFQGEPLPTGWTLGSLHGLRQWQVENYVISLCQALSMLNPRPEFTDYTTGWNEKPDDANVTHKQAPKYDRKVAEQLLPEDGGG